MRNFFSVLLLTFVSLPLSLQAEDQKDRVDSVVFKKQPAEDVEERSIKIETSEKSKYCSDLMKEAESLKGKPLKRSGTLQRYDLECKNMND